MSERLVKRTNDVVDKASSVGNNCHVAIMESQRLVRDVVTLLHNAHSQNEGGNVARVRVDFKDIAVRYEMVVEAYNRSAESVGDLNKAIDELNELLG
jgi:hypothetical protein